MISSPGMKTRRRSGSCGMPATNQTAAVAKSRRSATGTSTAYAGAAMLPSVRRLGPISIRSQCKAVPQIGDPSSGAQAPVAPACEPTRCGGAFVQREVVFDRLVEDLDPVWIEHAGPGHRHGPDIGAALNAHDGVMPVAVVPSRGLRAEVVDAPVVDRRETPAAKVMQRVLEPPAGIRFKLRSHTLMIVRSYPRPHPVRGRSRRDRMRAHTAVRACPGGDGFAAASTSGPRYPCLPWG